MRFSSSRARILMKGGGLALLWLLVPSIASAAMGSRRASARLCEPTVTLRKLARAVGALSGPVARPSTRALRGLSDVGVKLQRHARSLQSDDDEAIQNDAPAARIELDGGHVFALEPIGLLSRPCVRHPKTRDFSPRSPRGPPAGA